MKYTTLQLEQFKIQSMNPEFRGSVRNELFSEGLSQADIELLIQCITSKPEDHSWLNEIIKPRLSINDKFLWRGIPKETLQQLREHDSNTISFDRVLSASYDKKAAMDFASNIEYKTYTIFEISIPKVFNFQEYALKALQCKEYSSGFKNPDSHRFRNMELVSDEQEVMIPAGSLFEITDISITGTGEYTPQFQVYKLDFLNFL